MAPADARRRLIAISRPRSAFEQGEIVKMAPSMGLCAAAQRERGFVNSGWTVPARRRRLGGSRKPTLKVAVRRGCSALIRNPYAVDCVQTAYRGILPLTDRSVCSIASRIVNPLREAAAAKLVGL